MWFDIVSIINKCSTKIYQELHPRELIRVKIDALLQRSRQTWRHPRVYWASHMDTMQTIFPEFLHVLLTKIKQNNYIWHLWILIKVLLRIQVSLLKWSTHGNWQIIYPKSNLLTSPVPTEYFATNVFNYLHAAFKTVSLNEAESRSQVAPHVYSSTLHKCLNANLPHSWSGQVGTRMHSWLLKNNQFLIPERKTNLLITSSDSSRLTWIPLSQ